MENMDLIFKMWNFGVFWICTINSTMLKYGIFLIYFWYIGEFALLNLLSWKMGIFLVYYWFSYVLWDENCLWCVCKYKKYGWMSMRTQCYFWIRQCCVHYGIPQICLKKAKEKCCIRLMQAVCEKCCIRLM